MKINFSYFVLFWMLISLVGCGSKEEKVSESIQYLNQFTSQMMGKVGSKSDLIEGIKAGQAFLNSKKEVFKKKVALTKNTNRAQVSEKTMKAWQKAVVVNLKMVEDLKIKHVGQALRNPKLSQALNKLVKDYRDILQK
ncbi:MAG TPA: hypothetical protein DCS93_09425 [Microscillaceae bacterium]|nr:hypothetical protein [Microscillaceae bacterium]